MTTVPAISADCLGWAQAAGYSCTADEATGTAILHSAGPEPTRYYIRRRARDRIQLTQADDSDERIILFAVDTMVLERHLYGILGDDIRDDLSLPYLDLPWTEADLASGFQISAADSRGYRTLSGSGCGPVAAAPDPTMGLLTLVPLSHFLGLSPRQLRQSFLSESGEPLLRAGRYTSR